MLFAVFNPVTDQPKNVFELIPKIIYVLASSSTFWIIVGSIWLGFLALDSWYGHERQLKKPTQRHKATKETPNDGTV